MKTKSTAKSRTRNWPFSAASLAVSAAKCNLNGDANAASACGRAPSCELRTTCRNCCCNCDADEGHGAGQHVGGHMKNNGERGDGGGRVRAMLLSIFRGRRGRNVGLQGALMTAKMGREKWFSQDLRFSSYGRRRYPFHVERSLKLDRSSVPYDFYLSAVSARTAAHPDRGPSREADYNDFYSLLRTTLKHE